MEENVSITPPVGKLSRLRGERGQTLVEYALIIAVVSLGALAALGFLSGRIQNLFSKAGNSIEAVEVATSGGSGGSGGTPPPANNTPINNPPGNVGLDCDPGDCRWQDGAGVTGGAPGYTGLPGVYTTTERDRHGRSLLVHARRLLLQRHLGEPQRHPRA